MSRPRQLVATLSPVVIAALVACGSTSAFMPLNPPPHPVKPRPPEEVQMFTASAPTRPYVEVGLITAGIASSYSGDGDFEILGVLRQEAGKRGCEGVIVTGENKLATGTANEITGVTVTERTSGYRAVCIVFSDGAPESAPAASAAPAPSDAAPSGSGEPVAGPAAAP